jgi:hypothetical protein
MWTVAEAFDSAARLLFRFSPEAEQLLAFNLGFLSRADESID